MRSRHGGITRKPGSLEHSFKGGRGVVVQLIDWLYLVRKTCGCTANVDIFAVLVDRKVVNRVVTRQSMRCLTCLYVNVLRPVV